MNLHINLFLKQARHKKGLSIRELAKVSGVGKASIERIEAEKTTPRIDTLCKLAKALDVPVTELFRYECDGEEISPENRD